MKIDKIRCEICGSLSNLSTVKTKKTKSILCENHIKQLTHDPLVYFSDPKKEKYLRGKLEVEMNNPTSIHPGVNPFKRFGKEKLEKPYYSKRERIRLLLFLYGTENCREIKFSTNSRNRSSILEDRENNNKAKFFIADIINTPYSIIFQGVKKDYNSGIQLRIVDKEKITKTIVYL